MMQTQTLTIQVSDAVYQRLSQQVSNGSKSVDEFVEQVLANALLPSAGDVPAKWRADIEALQSLDDERLLEYICLDFPEDKMTVYESLLQKNEGSGLSETEQRQLELLRDDADLLMLRRAYAALLLRHRGHDIADPWLATNDE